ncbi:formylglycine-generating enzyme family protein [bacterium]|nr:formylglycine-generating enzyme family protein [bacterium]
MQANYYSLIISKVSNYIYNATIPGNIVSTTGIEYQIVVEYGGKTQTTPVYFIPVSATKSGETTTYKNITFVSIPGGTFRMGDVENYGKYSYEKPVHSVTVSSFEMSIYEVTQGQYQSVMGTIPSTSYGVGDNYPVYYVSWYDAVKFCNRLSEQMGYGKCYTESGNWDCDFSKSGFRLPTEAEWEYACRAGTETNFYTGNTISSDGQTSTDLERAGWYWYNWGQTNNKSHTVGEKEKNAFGLYDMHGNIWEWCNDWYGAYTSDNQTNPTGPTSGSYRVGRGGCWGDNAGSCRSADRRWDDPSYTNFYIGFRVVRRP